MPRYRCENIECSKYMREEIIPKVRLVYNKETNEFIPSEPILCSECKSDLVYVKQEGPITCRFNNFSSMTPQQKKEVLHKRSQDYFKKHDKGDLDNYKKSITDNLRKQAEGRL